MQSVGKPFNLNSSRPDAPRPRPLSARRIYITRAERIIYYIHDHEHDAEDDVAVRLVWMHIKRGNGLSKQLGDIVKMIVCDAVESDKQNLC